MFENTIGCAATRLLISATLLLAFALAGCGGGAGLPGAGDDSGIAEENDAQGSAPEIAEENENQGGPAPGDNDAPVPQDGAEEDGEGSGEYDFAEGVEVGIAEPPGSIEQLKIIPLTVGENLIDHWNFAESNGHIIEMEENFAGRELYMQVATVEYELTGLQDHWAIEAIEVRGFGHLVAGLWSSEFGFYWEGPTMYLDSSPTTTVFFPNDHIEDGRARLQLRTWAYADDIDASIYEVRIFVRNDMELQAADETSIGVLD